jgi:hypothetical protein
MFPSWLPVHVADVRWPIPTVISPAQSRWVAACFENRYRGLYRVEILFVSSVQQRKPLRHMQCYPTIQKYSTLQVFPA